MITFENKNKYCRNNPNYGRSNHFYVNNNCLYCKCEKTYSVSIIRYYISRLVRYFNKY